METATLYSGGGGLLDDDDYNHNKTLTDRPM